MLLLCVCVCAWRGWVGCPSVQLATLGTMTQELVDIAQSVESQS